MASIQKTARGYRAQVYCKGRRDSRVFATKRDAVVWASVREAELRDNRFEGDKHTLRDALRQYATDVSPGKRGEQWEVVRLRAFERYLLPLNSPISSVQPSDIALFRDSRAASVSAASVRRELTLLSSVFEMARREWGWVTSNPCHDVRKPRQPEHRNRTIHVREIRAMLRTMSYSHNTPANKTQALAQCFLFALRTGMRAGELCDLTWTNVHDDFVRLPQTKNGTSRDVPLSSRAIRIMKTMRGYQDDKVFGLHPRSVDALFRKYRDKAELSGFRWHDTRHTAATMLSRKVDVLTLCKIMGWHDTRFAMVYVNETPSVIAARLG